MSDNVNNEQDVEVLMESVYLPAFIKSCAANGVPIQDEQGLRSALDIAARLNYLEVAEAQTAASTTSALMKQASDVLGDQFQEMGLSSPTEASAVEKQASAVCDPRVLAALNRLSGAAASS